MTSATPWLAGEAKGPLVVLSAPLSFWGGVCDRTGTVADLTHPEHGANLKGRVVWLPELKGSGGTPGAVASLIKAGLGPAALLSPKGDANLLAGLIVARELYGTTVPYLFVKDPPVAAVISFDAAGNLTLD